MSSLTFVFAFQSRTRFMVMICGPPFYYTWTRVCTYILHISRMTRKVDFGEGLGKKKSQAPPPRPSYVSAVDTAVTNQLSTLPLLEEQPSFFVHSRHPRGSWRGFDSG